MNGGLFHHRETRWGEGIAPPPVGNSPGVGTMPKTVASRHPSDPHRVGFGGIPAQQKVRSPPPPNMGKGVMGSQPTNLVKETRIETSFLNWFKSCEVDDTTN
jgi:hypothetical protein